MSESHSLLLETARRAAHAASELLRRHMGQELVVKETFKHDVKIELDRQCQDLIEGIILAQHPSHAIIGEEGNIGAENPEFEWIIDPIDGTMNFLHQIPHFCISIAVRDSKSQQMVVGVILDPVRLEWFTAQRGQGAWLNGRKLAVSARTELSDAVLAVGFAKSQESIDHCLKLYTYYGSHAKKMRAMGSAALDLAYVAAGRLDAYIEQGVNLWDIAAGWLLIEEAGGVMDAEVKPNGGYRVLAHSGKITFPLK